MHRVGWALALAKTQVRIAIAQTPRPHLVPERLGRFGLLQAECAHRHRGRRGIGVQIAARPTHGKTTRRDEGQAIIRGDPEIHLVGVAPGPVRPSVPHDRLARAGRHTHPDRTGDGGHRHRPRHAAVVRGLEGHRDGGAARHGEVVGDVHQPRTIAPLRGVEVPDDRSCVDQTEPSEPDGAEDHRPDKERREQDGAGRVHAMKGL